ncbi:esterase FrsA [Enterovibrio sp. ZSDZ42]|uniref:Esterase FrsA n=1 Tax=Enterovibrio gelatinilyticus TaxID=2899819 RepID=A0ABT5QY23_9GAMM|nr:esterase FrsA [Enterovibrio sp. ZSDZ42]MDD1792659.1 esterase FrsA [Enterovibrio sp. ZSDZ42]
MRETESENLSVKLFKPTKHAKETSTIVGTANKPPKDVESVLDGQSDNSWYRVLRRPQWIWQGVDPIEMEETLARIAASDNDRSNEKLLDTVVGYRQGNWSYEWAQCGMKHQKRAQEKDEQGDKAGATAEWGRASACFSIAGYPHLKGDPLSQQTEILANKAFHAAMETSSLKIKNIVTKVDGKPLEGFLYLPHTNEPLPTVIVSGGMDGLQTDLLHLFETYFAPANIAMLTLDMPSVGRSSHWNLTEDSSRLHQAMLHELESVPWVDHHRVGCFGVRFGANAAVRMAFVEQNRIKSCVSVGGILHAMLTDVNRRNNIPPMHLDTIASRMGKSQASSTLLTQLQALSLRHQGLLNGRKTKVPILAIGLDGDPVCPDSDNQLAALYSYGGKAKTLPSKPIHDGYHRIMLEAIDWFNKTL